MSQKFHLSDLPQRITSRRGAWLSLGAVLFIFAALTGWLGQFSGTTSSDSAPLNSESARVAELMKQFPDADQQSVIIVAAKQDGTSLSAHDLGRLEPLSAELKAFAETEVTGPIVSEDQHAAMFVLPLKLIGDHAPEVGNSAVADDPTVAEIIGELRAELASTAADDLNLYVTGGPAFGVDVAAAFDGADFTLLAITVLIVALLLIVTYRSPVLWLLPLVTVGLADRLAALVTAALSSTFDLQYDAGIISVLVFGAGTNYALLFISRYREELWTSEDHRAALTAAWRKSLPAIAASNVTVVLALLTLTLAVIPRTHGLGLSAASGLIIALLAVLIILPALLAVTGRRVFWPFVPKPCGTGHADTSVHASTAVSTGNAVHAGNTVRAGGAWRSIAVHVVKRPAVSLGAGLGLLAIMASGLIGTSIGLNQIDKFRVASQSADGLSVLAEHFPAGEAQPMTVLSRSDAAPRVVEAISDVPGVVRVQPGEQSLDAAWTMITVVGSYVPGSSESLELVTELREVAQVIPDSEMLVGGAVATELDARDGNARDLLVLAPLILGVCFIVLLILLRSLLAPLLLLTINLASSVAAIGAGAWLGRIIFDQPALDAQVPVLAFLFLVALGIDYTIFLVDRVRSEVPQHGTRQGIIEAVAHTGSVITSAGIVLAAVFAALGVLPLVVLGQLGLIVGVGVVVDTLVVRTVVVPALFSLIGDKIWWPRRAHQRTQQHLSVRDPHANGV